MPSLYTAGARYNDNVKAVEFIFSKTLEGKGAGTNLKVGGGAHIRRDCKHARSRLADTLNIQCD